MNKLEWIARECEEWAEGTAWVFEVDGLIAFADFYPEGNCFNQEQWQAERERLGLDKPEWNGEGLPPVGISCEMKPNPSSEAWVAGAIQYKGSKFLIFKSDSGREFSRRIARVNFRQVRTEKEKAVDEVMTLLESYPPLERLEFDRRVIAQGLYKAGYRKQEQSK